MGVITIQCIQGPNSTQQRQKQRCARVDKEKSMRNSESTIGSVRKLGVGKVVFPRAEHSNSLLYQMARLKAYIKVTVFGLNWLYLEIYVHIEASMQQQLKKMGMNSKEREGACVGGFRQRKEKEEMLQLCYNT